MEGELPPVTLGEIRRRFLTEDFCPRAQDLRKNKLPYGGKGAFDYGMAALLGGCNNVKQPWQLNYYNFAIADYTKKQGSKTWPHRANLLAAPKKKFFDQPRKKRSGRYF